MNFYWVKTNWLVKKIFPNFIWSIPNSSNKIYLTFDDGPTPEVTPYVLDILKQHNLKAAFFCIGENIQKYPKVFKQILEDGHAIGNHTFNHLNGWNTDLHTYLDNVALCDAIIKREANIETGLFRPPYGKISRTQSKEVRKSGKKIVMWDILTVDYDVHVTREQCLKNATQKATSGSVIIFHDSKKAYPNLEYALPKTIEILKAKGFTFDLLPQICS